MAKRSNTMNQILKSIGGETYKPKKKEDPVEVTQEPIHAVKDVAHVQRKGSKKKKEATEYNTIRVDKRLVNILKMMCFASDRNVQMMINEIVVEWLEENEGDVKKALSKISKLSKL